MAEAAENKPHPLVVLKSYLTDRIETFRSALPPHINPDRFIAAVMTAVQLNPDLAAADRRSLFLACVRCAQDGLLPDGTEAAIIPFKSNAQYIPMYQGLLKKFRNSGQFKWVTAGIAYEGEIFEHWITETGEHFRHVPGENTGKVHRVYALATTKDGGSFITTLSEREINKRRNMSRASRDDAPWKQWPDEMAKKTALRVLAKLLPKSSDLDAFIQRDEAESLGAEPVAPAPVIGSTGNVLDHFAKDESSGAAPSIVDRGTSHDDAASGGEQGPDARTSGSAAADVINAAADAVILEAAYERGQHDRAAGHSRKAMPGEYRDKTKTAEAAAWLRGWDGQEFNTE